MSRRSAAILDATSAIESPAENDLPRIRVDAVGKPAAIDELWSISGSVLVFVGPSEAREGTIATIDAVVAVLDATIELLDVATDSTGDATRLSLKPSELAPRGTVWRGEPDESANLMPVRPAKLPFGPHAAAMEDGCLSRIGTAAQTAASR